MNLTWNHFRVQESAVTQIMTEWWLTETGVFCLNLFNISHFYMDSPCNHGVWNWLQCEHLHAINTVLHPGFHLIEPEPQEVQHDRDQEKKGGLMKQSVSNLLLFNLFSPNSLQSLSVFHSVSVCLVLYTWPLFSISLTFLLYVFNTTETLRCKGLPLSQLPTSLCLH